MATTAAKFESGNDSLQSMLNLLMSELSVLQSAWQGAGGRSFEQVKQAWERDQKAIQQALLETANAIRTSGQQYTSTDADAAGRVSASNRGVDLPL